MPLQRRIPKRGFNNIFAKEIVAINAERPATPLKTAQSSIRQHSLKQVSSSLHATVLRFFPMATLTKKLTVKANAFSEAAKAEN